MSRMGRRPISLPLGVEVHPSDSSVEVKGSKGSVVLEMPNYLHVEVVLGQAIVSMPRSGPRAMFGTFRAHLANAITGLSVGFEMGVIMEGPGYRASVSGKKLSLKVGYSHPIELSIPEGVDVSIERSKIKIQGVDRQVVGGFTDSILNTRPVEPYKLQGLRREGVVMTKKKRRVVGA